MARALEAIKRNKVYKPKTKKRIDIVSLKAVIRHIQRVIKDKVMAAAFKVMYFTAMRQSEIVPRRVKLFDPTKNMTRGDIKMHKGSTTLVIKAAKNLQYNGQKRVVAVPEIKNSSMCPVAVVKCIIQAATTHKRQDPFLMYESGTPMPISHIDKVWK